LYLRLVGFDAVSLV